MSKKQVSSAGLTPAAVVGRAKSMATQWMWAVSLQHDRITSPRPQDKAFHPFGIDGFHEADGHFFVIALRRLRTVATTFEHAPQQWDSVRSAIGTFDERLRWLKPLRDVFEHLEDYAVDSNCRRSNTSRRELQAWSAGENGMPWLGYDVDWNQALSAAQDLFGTVKTAFDSFASQGGLPNGQAQDRGAARKSPTGHARHGASGSGCAQIAPGGSSGRQAPGAADPHWPDLVLFRE